MKREMTVDGGQMTGRRRLTTGVRSQETGVRRKRTENKKQNLK